LDRWSRKDLEQLQIVSEKQRLQPMLSNHDLVALQSEF
jgi:hypothetical protein